MNTTTHITSDEIKEAITNHMLDKVGPQYHYEFTDIKVLFVVDGGDVAADVTANIMRKED